MRRPGKRPRPVLKLALDGPVPAGDLLAAKEAGERPDVSPSAGEAQTGELQHGVRSAPRASRDD